MLFVFLFTVLSPPGTLVHKLHEGNISFNEIFSELIQFGTFHNCLSKLYSSYAIDVVIL